MSVILMILILLFCICFIFTFYFGNVARNIFRTFRVEASITVRRHEVPLWVSSDPNTCDVEMPFSVKICFLRRSFVDLFMI